jgi:hypothetical protein
VAANEREQYARPRRLADRGADGGYRYFNGLIHNHASTVNEVLLSIGARAAIRRYDGAPKPLLEPSRYLSIS